MQALRRSPRARECVSRERALLKQGATREVVAPRPGPIDTIRRTHEDTDLRDITEDLTALTGHNVVVDPNVKENLNLSFGLAPLPWRRDVELAANAARCRITELPRGTLWLDQPPRVTIQFTDASLRTVLQLLAAYSGKNILLPPGDLGICATDLREVVWSDALRLLALGARLDVVSLPPRHDVILVSRAPPTRPPLFLVAEPERFTLPDLAGLAPRETTVDLDADDEDLGGFLGELESVLGIELRLDPEVQEKANLLCCEMPWEDAIAATALVTRTRARREGNALVFEQPPKLTMQMSDCPASTWFELVGRASGRRVVVPRDLPGALTLDLREMSYVEMMRVVSIAFGYELVERGGEIRIGAGLARPTETRPSAPPPAPPTSDLASLAERVASARAAAEVEQAGAAILSAASREVQSERYESAIAEIALIDSLASSAGSIGGPDLPRKLEALRIRAKAIADEARQRIELRAVPIEVRAILIERGHLDHAVVNGKIVMVGDPLPGKPDVTIVRINEGSVKFRSKDVEFFRELATPR